MDEEYIINPYNPCIANKIINEKQHTVMWHVDNLKFSHVDKKVNNKFVEQIRKNMVLSKKSSQMFSEENRSNQ